MIFSIMAPFKIHRIASLEIPELQPYRTLRRAREHLVQGIFVAEGEKVVRRFLASPWQVISLLLTQEWFDSIVRLVPESRLADAEVYIGEKTLLETIVGFPLHQGIMAVGMLPAERSLEQTVADLPSPHMLVALDGLVHAENVGVVVRNCAAFGAQAMLVGRTSASPYLRRAVRNSMGGIFTLPCVHVEHLAASLASLKRRWGTRIVVADAHARLSIHAADFSGNLCIVFGNEDAGVSDEVDAIATDRVRIPMHHGTDSLNVASASAVFLYQISSSRGTNR